MRIAGEETQQVDVFENTDEFAVLRNRNPLLVMLRHLEQRGRDKIAWSDAYDRAPRERPDRAFDGEPIENRRVQEIRAGHDAGFGAFLDQEGVTVGGLHPGAGVGDCLLSIHEHRGMKEKVADSRAQQRRKTRRLFLLRGGAKLVGDVKVEERREAPVLVDKPKRDVARQQIAERLLPRDEGIGSAALHEGPAVKRIAGAVQCDEILAVPLLHKSLDDDEETVGRLVAPDNRLIRAEICDVERIPNRIELLGG